MARIEDLIVDPDEVNETLLAEMLLPYVSIEKGSGKTIFKELWYELNIRQKILAFLASRKAAVISEIIDKEAESQQPRDIEKHTEIKGASVRPTLKQLKDEKLLAQTPDGGYFIPNVKLRIISTEFSKTN